MLCWRAQVPDTAALSHSAEAEDLGTHVPHWTLPVGPAGAKAALGAFPSLILRVYFGSCLQPWATLEREMRSCHRHKRLWGSNST